VHLGGLLADNQLAVVSGRQLIQTEEAEVAEDLEECRIVAIRVAQVPFEEDSCENLDENHRRYSEQT